MHCVLPLCPLDRTNLVPRALVTLVQRSGKRETLHTAAKWVRMLRVFVIQSWIDYECSTSIAKFTPVTKIFFLLNKICDGASSKEPFLKAATLAILIWAYPREMRTSNWNFKKAAFLPSKIAHAWRACALIWPLWGDSGIKRFGSHSHWLNIWACVTVFGSDGAGNEQQNGGKEKADFWLRKPPDWFVCSQSREWESIKSYRECNGS